MGVEESTEEKVFQLMCRKNISKELVLAQKNECIRGESGNGDPGD